MVGAWQHMPHLDASEGWHQNSNKIGASAPPNVKKVLVQRMHISCWLGIT